MAFMCSGGGDELALSKHGVEFDHLTHLICLAHAPWFYQGDVRRILHIYARSKTLLAR